MISRPSSDHTEAYANGITDTKEGALHLDRTGPEAVRRGPWSPEEDHKLMEIISLYGPLNWVRVSLSIRTRLPKQCRERYHQNLKPLLNRNPITYEEGLLIEQLVAKYGKKWAEIARHLTGRLDNAIKNWWNGGANRRRRASHVLLPGQSQTQAQTQPQSHKQASQMPMYAVPPPSIKADAMVPTYGYPLAHQPLNHQAHMQAHARVQVHAPDQTPLAWVPRTDPPALTAMRMPSMPSLSTLPGLPNLPSLPPVTFNTTMFNDHRSSTAPATILAQNTNPQASPDRNGSAGVVSTLPALYHTGGPAAFPYSELHNARAHGSWGSASSIASSGTGPYYEYSGHTTAATAGATMHPTVSRLSTSSSSQPTLRRASLPTHDTPYARTPTSILNLVGPTIDDGGRKRESLQNAQPPQFVHGRTHYVPGTPAPAQDVHFVVPPFRLLVRSINSPPSTAANAGSAESIRVSSLIN